MDADHQIWSFDHGWWIGGGGDWTAADLARQVQFNNAWPDSVKGMSAAAFVDVAKDIESLTMQDLLTAVACVPVQWGFPEEDLIAIAKWLDQRRPSTVTRLRKHATNV
jgi:hypothetical protein